jgi:hypothetical protein
MNGRSCRVAPAMVCLLGGGLLGGCAGASEPATDASGDFSVVLGVPAEWAPRVDEARYLDAADCAVLCPVAFRKRVRSCHLARVRGAEASAETAAVVCNGGPGGGAP